MGIDVTLIMVTLGQPIYKAVVAEIMRWNEAIRHVSIVPIEPSEAIQQF